MTRQSGIRRLLLVVLTAALALQTACAQETNWEKANAAGMKALQEARYTEAEQHLTAALKQAEKFGEQDARLATSLKNLAVLYQAQFKFEQAELLVKQTLAIDEKTLGPEHPDMATAVHNLAVLYRYQGKYAEAEPLFKRALAIQEKALGPENQAVATSLVSLANFYRDQGKYAKAEAHYQRALPIYEKALGPEHPEVAGILASQALLYSIQGKYAEAEPLFKRALPIFEKALGPEQVAASLELYADVLREMGRDEEAKKLEARAQAIRAKHAQENPPK